MNWKATIFGNPFSKKGKSKKKTFNSAVDSGLTFGQPNADEEDDPDVLRTKTFASRQEASDVYREELRRLFSKELFYSISIRCPNCRIEGVVRLERGVQADGAECPRCEVLGLEVTGVGSDSSGDIIHTPSLDEETESTITEQVQNAVEHAWSVGRIKRGGIFDD